MSSEYTIQVIIYYKYSYLSNRSLISTNNTGFLFFFSKGNILQTFLYFLLSSSFYQRLSSCVPPSPCAQMWASGRTSDSASSQTSHSSAPCWLWPSDTPSYHCTPVTEGRKNTIVGFFLTMH